VGKKRPPKKKGGKTWTSEKKRVRPKKTQLMGRGKRRLSHKESKLRWKSREKTGLYSLNGPVGEKRHHR